jgi:thymidylate synthase (FAD)
MVPAHALGPDLLTRLERYARVCYKSENKMGPEYNAGFLKNLLKLGHESIIEHEKATVLIITDRGVTHELVRHRIAAYSQQSTRYCSFNQDKFGHEITVIEPFFYRKRPAAWDLWRHACLTAEKSYMELLEAGSSPQEARSVLPNSLKTEIVVTFNMREWRHFFRLRCDTAAHPQMRQVAIPLLLHFQKLLPDLFLDIEYDHNFDPGQYAQVVLTDDIFQAL